MDRDIPIVDITSSQEEMDHINGRKRKDVPTVTIVGTSPKRPRSGGDTPTSSKGNSIVKADLVMLHSRLDTLENSVRKVEEQKTEDQYVTREEFDEVLGKMARVEERLTKMEQIFKNIKSAFVGKKFQSQQRSCPENSAPRISRTAGSSGSPSGNAATSSTEKIRAQAISSVANSRTVTSTITAANNSVAAQTRVESTSEKESATSQSQPTDLTMAPPKQARVSGQMRENSTITAGNIGSTQQRKSLPNDLNSGPSGREQRPSNSNLIAGMSSFRSEISITPVKPSSTSGRDQQLSSSSKKAGPPSASGNTPQRAGPSSTSRQQQFPSTSSKAGPSSTTGRDPCLTSSNLTKKLPEILDAPPSEWSGQSAIIMTDELMGSIRVKQEVYDHPLDRINTTVSIRKDSDQRYLVYIDGNSKKKRNHDVYAAVAGYSLSDDWNRVIPYRSDLHIGQGNYRKLAEAVRRQTEVIAAYVAIEDIKKKHAGSGRIKMRIVARNRQLVQIMNRGGLRYVYPMVDQYCDCSEFRCAHNERWETVDNFAKSLNDDLPRLVLAAAGIDVEWRTYLPTDPEIDQNKLKSGISGVLQNS